MSTVRRRAKPRSQSQSKHSEEEKDTPGTSDNDALELITSTDLHNLKKEAHNASSKPVKGTKRRFAWIFALGGIFGLLLAAMLANNNDLIDIASSLTDLNLEGMLDVLPAGFINEARQFQVSTCLETCHCKLIGVEP